MFNQKWIVYLIALVLAYVAGAVFIPVFVALFMAMLLEPVTQWLTGHKVARPLASFLVVGAFLTVTCAGLWVVYLYLSTLVLKLPENMTHFTEMTASLREIADKLDLSTRAFEPAVGDVQRVQIVSAYPAWSTYLVRGVGTLYEFVTLAVFVPLLLFLFLLEKETLVETGNVILGKYFYIPRLNAELPKMIRSFCWANILMGLSFVVVHAIVLFALGYNNFFPLALITGFANIIPLAGAPLAMIFGIAQGVTQFHVLSPLVLMMISFVFIHLIGNNVLLPRLVGHRVNVNNSALIFGFLFWSWLWGAMGFLLAIPMTALLKILWESSPDTVPLANLLAAKPKYIVGTRVQKGPSLDL